MDTTILTIRLAKTERAFLEEYAQRHRITISELIDQYIKQLQISEKYSFHNDVDKYTGDIPDNIDAQKEYYDHIEEKHK